MRDGTAFIPALGCRSGSVGDWRGDSAAAGGAGPSGARRERVEDAAGNHRGRRPRGGRSGGRGGVLFGVVTNPPYRTLDSSPPSPNEQRALAHHEIALRLPEWVAVAARAVRPGGRVAAILPVERSTELIDALAANGLRPARTRNVHPHAGEPASRLLIEARRGLEGPRVLESAAGRPPAGRGSASRLRSRARSLG